MRGISATRMSRSGRGLTGGVQHMPPPDNAPSGADTRQPEDVSDACRSCRSLWYGIMSGLLTVEEEGDRHPSGRKHEINP